MRKRLLIMKTLKMKIIRMNNEKEEVNIKDVNIDKKNNNENQEKKTNTSSLEKLIAVKKLLHVKGPLTKPPENKNITNKTEITNLNKQDSSKKNNNNNKKSNIENSNLKNKLLNEKRKREEDKKIIKKSEKIKKRKEEEEEEEEEDSEFDSDYNESEESESSSSSSSSSESSISSEKKHNKKKINKSPKKKKSESKKKTNNNNNKILKPKAILVYQLLKRWWYALPKWPPENYNCEEKLRNNKLRVVNLIDWKKEPKYDDFNNFEKCFELPGFKYVYCNSNGKLYDFRPEENKPSFNSFMKLPDVKLYEYLIEALKKQIDILQKENLSRDKKLIHDLEDELEKNERIYNRIKNNK